MRKLKVTKENYKKLNAVTETLDWDFDKALEAFLDINNVLDELLPKGPDWGGNYGSFLESVGIESNSDEGWWSLSAIDPENIQFYVDYMNCDKDEINNMIDERYQQILSLRHIGYQVKFNSHREAKLSDMFKVVF